MARNMRAMWKNRRATVAKPPTTLKGRALAKSEVNELAVLGAAAKLAFHEREAEKLRLFIKGMKA